VPDAAADALIMTVSSPLDFQCDLFHRTRMQEPERNRPRRCCDHVIIDME
jgi:hypothetical protein